MTIPRDTIAQLAELVGVPAAALANLCSTFWRPGDRERAALRLQLFRIPATPDRSKSKPEIYRARVAHLVNEGLAPSRARAIELVAIEFGVKAETVHEALYRRHRQRVPPGVPPDGSSPEVQSRSP